MLLSASLLTLSYFSLNIASFPWAGKSSRAGLAEAWEWVVGQRQARRQHTSRPGLQQKQNGSSLQKTQRVEGRQFLGCVPRHACTLVRGVCGGQCQAPAPFWVPGRGMSCPVPRAVSPQMTRKTRVGGVYDTLTWGSSQKNAPTSPRAAARPVGQGLRTCSTFTPSGGSGDLPEDMALDGWDLGDKRREGVLVSSGRPKKIP